MKCKISLLSASIAVALFGAGIDAATAGNGVDISPAGITLAVTLALDNGTPTQCGTATTLSVTIGDQVNFCYKVTNNTTYTLHYQSLSDSVTGVILTYLPGDIAPGATYQYNRIVTAGATESPASTWTSQDALPGYASSAGTYAWIDAIGGTTIIPALGDDGSAPLTLPFPFTFAGIASSNICVDNNGFILFNTTTCPTSGLYNNDSLPSAQLPAAAILPFWNDLSTAGSTFYTTIGTMPNRQFVVEWYNKNFFDTPSLTFGYTFEVVFNEADGTLDFNYQDVAATPATPTHDNGISATVGLQESSTLANLYSYKTASLSNSQNIHWTPTSPNIFVSAPQTVTLDVGAPILALTPTSLSGSANAGASTTTTLNIGNTGNRDLLWNLTSAPPTAHFPSIPGLPRFAMDAPNAAARARVKTTAAAVEQRTRKPQPAPLTAAIPAFIVDSGAPNSFGSIDVAAPGTFTTIAPIPTGLPKSGTFIHNDFSKEYIGDIGSSTATPPVPSHTFTIDTTTGAVTPLGGAPATSGEVWIGLKWDATTSTLWGAGCGTATPSNCHLYTVDPTTGAVTQGPMISGIAGTSGTFLVDIAIDQRGLMYAIDYNTANLVAIDKTTGAAQVIGATGVTPAYIQAMDFDQATNVLYWASYGSATGGTPTGVMYQVNTTTGAATAPAPLSNGDEQFAFAIAVAGGPCATPSRIPWLAFTPASGTTTPSGTDPVTVTLDASALTGSTHRANICVNTNDQNNKQVAVPVTFTVHASDQIFVDGFDGP